MPSNFFNILQDDYNINLNEQQKSAVMHKDGPAAILAVPGSGKTTVLICRTANLIRNYGINPFNILSVTFSKASALDMQNRFNGIFKNLVPEGIRFSTIHSFAYYVVREYSNTTGIKFNVIEDEKSGLNKTAVLKQIYHKVNNAYINEDKLDELVTNISYVKNMMIDEKNLKSSGITIPGFEDIYKQYEGLKRSNNLIDYDDMLTFAYEILKCSPILLNKYRKRFQYIQVDESQDTSKIQHEIIRLIAHPKNNIFLVGDEDQSIYNFRGAYPEAILSFQKVYREAKVLFMEENFRSTKSIVELANMFIKENKKRHNKNLFTKKDIGETAEVIDARSQEDQIKYVVNQLKSIENVKETAILFRNNLSSIALIDALDREKIDFYVRDFKHSFFNHWVVQDIIAFISLAINSEDSDSFERIYYKMNSYISKKSVDYIKRNYKGECVFTSMKKCPDIPVFQVNRIDKLHESFRGLSYKSARDAIDYVEKELMYKKYLDENSERLGYSLENTNSMLSTLKLIAEGTGTIIGFLSRLENLQSIMENAKSNKYKNVVTLSTIHSSKGLEFDNVYMIDLIEGEFPSSGSIKALESRDNTLIEEERRLFYVGMTRARNRLKLIKVNYKNGERVYASRFIDEIVSITGKNNIGGSNVYLNTPKVGQLISHGVFGTGTVKSVNKDTLEIQFDSAGIKTLSIDACIEKRLLTVIASL
jgi:DNA helicase II / ATP-dependent DNA helicase PcrA